MSLGQRLRRVYLSAIAGLEKRATGRYGLKSCEEITATLSQSMEQNLSFSQRLAVRFHFSYCRLCARYARHLKALRLLARRLAEEDSELNADARLPEDAKRRILAAMKQNEP